MPLDEPRVASSASLRSRAESSYVATPRAVLALAAASTSPRPFRGARSRRAVTFDRGEERERVAPHACAGSSPKPAAPERPGVSTPTLAEASVFVTLIGTRPTRPRVPRRPCPTCVVEHERRSAGGSLALSRKVAGDLHPRESARPTARRQPPCESGDPSSQRSLRGCLCARDGAPTYRSLPRSLTPARAGTRLAAGGESSRPPGFRTHVGEVSAKRTSPRGEPGTVVRGRSSGPVDRASARPRGASWTRRVERARQAPSALGSRSRVSTRPLAAPLVSDEHSEKRAA